MAQAPYLVTNEAANKINNPQRILNDDVLLLDEVTMATIISSSSSSDEFKMSSHNIEPRSWMMSTAMTNTIPGDLEDDDLDPLEKKHMRM
jgi:hypothetical protein